MTPMEEFKATMRARALAAAEKEWRASPEAKVWENLLSDEFDTDS